MTDLPTPRRTYVFALAAAVGRLLDEPDLAHAARRLGESIRRDAGSGTLVAELESIPTPTAATR
jgi:hypothetical protein